MPLDFIYEKGPNKYMLENYETDEQLLEKVQTGRGDLAIYEGDFLFLFVEGIFSGTEPAEIEQ